MVNLEHEILPEMLMIHRFFSMDWTFCTSANKKQISWAFMACYLIHVESLKCQKFAQRNVKTTSLQVNNAYEMHKLVAIYCW